MSGVPEDSWAFGSTKTLMQLLMQWNSQSAKRFVSAVPLSKKTTDEGEPVGYWMMPQPTRPPAPPMGWVM